LSKKYTYEEIKYFIEVESKSGCKLISKEYIDTKKELEIKCNCETPFNVRFDSFKYKNQRKCKVCNKLINWNLEKIKNYISNFSLKLLSNKYKNNRTKLTAQDDDGYMYVFNIHDFTSGHKPEKFHKSSPYTIYNIKLWIYLNDKPFKLLSNIYKGNSKKIKWKCLKDDCGEEFEASWNSIFTDGGCGYCHGLQVGLSNCLATKNPELAKEWHPILNGDLTPYDVTCGSNKDVWWLCSKNPKHKWHTAVSDRNNGNGCPYCAGLYPSDDYNLLYDNPELCKEWDYKKNKKSPEEFTPNSSKSVWWICKKCGHNWPAIINARNKKNGKSIGCPKCNESKGEKRIEKYLISKDLYYIYQYKIKKCKNKRVLPFDFGIFYDKGKIKLRIIIEYDGIFHYEDIFNKPKEFKKQQLNDEIKNTYCKNNNIRLLRIPYWDFDNIEKILEKELIKKEENLW